MAIIFGNKYAYAMQNLILAAMGSEAATAPGSGQKYEALLSHQWLETFTPDPVVPAFTDSFAPVERYALIQ